MYLFNINVWTITYAQAGTGHFLVGRHSSGADVVGAFLYFFADWPTILEGTTKMRGPQTFFGHSPVLYKIPCNQRLLEFGDSKRT